ncbi:glycoside hydrolase family 26 protein [Roseibium sp. MMSF_3412]|uniref:glycoside hydrolase family 26 protein n=1 Tax=Roseibium sp. MMSF_3412 TaxID=3046712 RepID=UPI00273D7C48|nr:glycosyl hydrolase [Roseibium sp. MMSF_3412]
MKQRANLPKISIRTGILATVVGAASMVAVAQVANGNTDAGVVVPRPSADIAFGAYDPPGFFTDRSSVSVEHLFLPWEDVELESLLLADQYAKERGRSVLLTIEPWTWGENWDVSPAELRAGIAAGDYDPNIAAICTVAGAMESQVMIRWAQEMESTSGRFTWSGWEPEAYIDAYRHVVDVCRQSAPDAGFMWSPKGEEGLQAYYPGDDYADVVGLSIFGLQQWDKDKFGGDRSFSETLSPAYDRVVGFGKPVYVAELGYVGDRDYVTDWAGDVTSVGEEFPELTTVIYFNDKEVWPWPDGYGLPDWRITEQILPANS